MIGVPGDARMRVLVAARWYPSHDAPARGIFVADLVRALADAGVEPFVVSWEPALASGSGSAVDPGVTRAVARWAAVAPFAHATRPRSWGAPSVPIVRLPAIVPTAEGTPRDPLDLANLQAATLVPFGLALAARWPYAVIHAHTGVDGLAAARLADRLGLPLLVSEHDSTIEASLVDERLRAAYRGLLDDRRRVVAVSPSFRDGIARRLQVEPPRIGILPNPVDVDAFRPVGPSDRDATELLWVGARKSSKGIETLIRAFALARSQRPELRLRLIGAAPVPDEDDRMRSLAAELGLAGAISFEPPADRAGVAAAMARAAVFVHPSPRETFGVVAAEALAAGLPVAATPSGGVEAILGRDGRCGTIAADTGPEALAAAIAATLDRRSTFDPETLWARVSESFAPSIIAAATIDLYRQLGAEDRSTVGAGEPATAPPAVGRTEPPPGAPFAPPLVVGFRRRSAASRIAALPPDLAGDLEIVTSIGRSRDDPALPPGRWTEVDADRPYRLAVRAAGGPVAPASSALRVARALRHPLRTYRLRRLAARRNSLIVRERLEAVRAALGAAGPGEMPGRSILALDADDVLAVADLLDAGGTLEPGTLRGLADAWDAAGRPTPAAVVEARSGAG